MRRRLFPSSFLLVFLVLVPLQDRAVATGHTFLTAPTFSLGNGSDSQSLAVADFNGDGKLDVVTANSYNPSSVSVLLNKGNGTFRAAVNYSVGGALTP